MTSPQPEQLHLRLTPRATRTFATAFGPGGVTVGTGDQEVVVTLTPAAADQLARVIGASPVLRDVDVDDQAWIAVMIDLLSCAALADGPLPLPRLVRLAGTAT